MSFPSIIVHLMIPYTLHIPLNWKINIPLKLLHPLHISIYYFLGLMGPCLTKLYDKRGDFDFRIVNFHYIFSNISESLAYMYGVYISQLIRYARACSSYGDFIDRRRLLTRKLLNQCYTLEKLKI